MNHVIPTPNDPRILSADEVLTGPDRDIENLEVDDIFATSLEDLLTDYRSSAPEDIVLMDAEPRRASITNRGYAFADVPIGIVVVHGPNEDIVGAYLGGSIAVDPRHQGLDWGQSLRWRFISRMAVLQFGTMMK